jgi:hypothetical protein
VICGSWRSILTLDSVVGGLPSVKGKMTFAVVAVHKGRSLSCRGGRRFGIDVVDAWKNDVRLIYCFR